LAGSLRHTHSRLSEFAEEIAFFGGEETEKRLIEHEYAALVQHEQGVMNKRWWYGCAEEGIVKWLWGSFGVCTRQAVSWNKHNIYFSLSSAQFLFSSSCLEYQILT
jgi:ABC-type uncharacterized transport system fused permease/ATPase subunit